MIRSRYEIKLKGGVKVELLFTLALFGIAKKKSISMDLPADADVADRISYYVKMIYCAALLAAEYRAIDNPQEKPLEFEFIDFAEWAADNPRDFARLIKGASSAIAGIDVDTEGDEDVKKKK